jgi:hypothetical protein
MAKYGETAVRAVSVYTNGKASSIVDAWEIVARETFRSESSQEKGCPRSTFLGVCESGIVAGVPAGEYNSKITKNKQYGLKAIALLRHHPELADSPDLLWSKVRDAGGNPTGQMDVIATMWKHGLIKAKP